MALFLLRRKRKSQASIEYMVVIGILLLALGPLLYYGYTELNAKNAIAQGKALVQEVASTTNQLRAHGQGSRLVIQVQMPQNVDSASVGGRQIMLKMRSPNGALTDVFAVVNANVTGSLPIRQGTYFLNITVLDNGNVSINPSS